MAYARLANSYNNLNQPSLAIENVRKAYELRQRTSQRERFYIESKYEWIVNEDWLAASKIFEAWQQAYPRDDIPPNNLAMTYMVLGDPQKRLAAVQQSMRLDPGSGIGYANLAVSYIALNRLDEAKATIKEAQTRGHDAPNFHVYLYWIGFLERDAVAMQREADILISKPGNDPEFLGVESQTAAYNGQLTRARELAGHMIDLLKRTDSKEEASSSLAEVALREALMGNLALAKRQAEEAIQLGCNKDCEAVAAIVLAMTGEPARAQRTADSLNSRYPKSTTVQYFYLPMLHSAIALANGNAARAVEAFAVAAPYELGSPYGREFLMLYLVYFRGQAYLAAHQGTQAAAEFQKILDNSGLVLNEPIGALAHVGLARSYVMSGDSASASTAYQDFSALWKDADPDIPILKQAKAEYAKLLQ